MKLHFRTMGEGKSLVILHGLFGSSDNWQTLAKGFSETNKVYLVDQRNHGLSPHSNVFDYDVMAEDLKEFFDDNGIEKAYVLGHSMGGKAAMTFAARFPDMIEKLVVVDIGSRQYPPHHENIFNGFRSVNLETIETRKDADAQLATSIPDFGVRQFILKNLTRNGNGGFEWRVNLDSLERNAHEVGRALDASDCFEGPTLFIGGEKSKYIQIEDHEEIHQHFPSAEIEMVAGAGHWIHAEKPTELYNLVSDFLAR